MPRTAQGAAFFGKSQGIMRFPGFIEAETGRIPRFHERLRRLRSGGEIDAADTRIVAKLDLAADRQRGARRGRNRRRRGRRRSGWRQGKRIIPKLDLPGGFRGRRRLRRRRFERQWGNRDNVPGTVAANRQGGTGCGGMPPGSGRRGKSHGGHCQRIRIRSGHRRYALLGHVPSLVRFRTGQRWSGKAETATLRRKFRSSLQHRLERRCERLGIKRFQPEFGIGANADSRRRRRNGSRSGRDGRGRLEGQRRSRSGRSGQLKGQ